MCACPLCDYPAAFDNRDGKLIHPQTGQTLQEIVADLAARLAAVEEWARRESSAQGHVRFMPPVSGT